MKKHLLLGVALGAGVVIGNEPTARACGGCFHGPDENPTVVTDHRMIFSISKDQATLYDQIKYSGNPKSFAWVLPFAGDIDVGVSSDALFNALDQQTQTAVYAPPLNCPAPVYCGYSSSGSLAGSSASSSGYGGGVTVLHDEVVGPYETVQLKATDPQALEKWLSDHNYAIPDAVKPVIAAYEAENFNFLAIKLVPGQNVQSMKPIRVTTKGSNVALPLRMVAAGTGATVGITLWVVAEGRYEPANFGSFLIRAEDLTWDYTAGTSDYAKIRADRTAAGGGKVWEIESVTPSLRSSITSTVQSVFDQAYDEEKTDAGIVTQTSRDAYNEDMATLFAGIPEGAERITRLRADLAHDALDRDLTLRAALSQDEIPGTRNVTRSVNAPACPTYPPCESDGAFNGTDGRTNRAAPSGEDDGCQTSPGNTSLPWLGVFVAAALTILVRSRKEKR